MLLAKIEIVIAGIVLILFLTFFFTVGKVFTLWLQAVMAGVPLSIFDVLGMRFRKTDMRVVVRALIMATQAGVSVTSRKMESAYLQGVDLEKITLAMIHAKREGMEVTFQDLVEADLENRLHKKLGIQKDGQFLTQRESRSHSDKK